MFFFCFLRSIASPFFDFERRLGGLESEQGGRHIGERGRERERERERREVAREKKKREKRGDDETISCKKKLSVLTFFTFALFPIFSCFQNIGGERERRTKALSISDSSSSDGSRGSLDLRRRRLGLLDGRRHRSPH